MTNYFCAKFGANRYSRSRENARTELPTDRPTDRQTDRPTDRHTFSRNHFFGVLMVQNAKIRWKLEIEFLPYHKTFPSYSDSLYTPCIRHILSLYKGESKKWFGTLVALQTTFVWNIFWSDILFGGHLEIYKKIIKNFDLNTLISCAIYRRARIKSQHG